MHNNDNKNRKKYCVKNISAILSFNYYAFSELSLILFIFIVVHKISELCIRLCKIYLKNEFEINKNAFK